MKLSRFTQGAAALSLSAIVLAGLLFGSVQLRAQNRTPVPNIPLNDAMGQFWSLKTHDDGSGNQEVSIYCEAGCGGTPTTSGGLTMSRQQVANNTTSVAVKAGPGNLYNLDAFSNTATIAYVKLYDALQANVTCGSGTPVYQGMIPGPTVGGSGFLSQAFYGRTFLVGITACVTTGFADNDTSAPAASAYVINYAYK